MGIHIQFTRALFLDQPPPLYFSLFSSCIRTITSECTSTNACATLFALYFTNFRCLVYCVRATRTYDDIDVHTLVYYDVTSYNLLHVVCIRLQRYFNSTSSSERPYLCIPLYVYSRS